jgi:putative ABC transport system permease protein
LGIPNDAKTETYEVIGVVEDVPSNSTIQFEVLLPNRNFNVEKMHWSWVWTQLETFVLFAENANMDAVRNKLSTIPAKRAEETLQRVMNISYTEYVASGKKWELFLQPIGSLHLPKQTVISSFPDIADLKLIYSLIGAAIFIMILSCINFTNLSTAQFTRRIKEAGVRKILGLGKAGLALGYFLEALTFCALALVAAVACTQIVLPGFNMLTAKDLSLSFVSQPDLIAWLLALVVFMAIISSLYPAIFLGSFRPADAVKGKIRVGKRGGSFRNGLVVFQFSVSIVLIICTAVVFQQLKYFTEKDLGFDKENLIRIKHAEGVKNGESLVKALQNIPGVISASNCTSAPPEIFGGDKFTAEGLNGENFSLNYTSADERFIPALGINVMVGRNFSEDTPSDVSGVILNESAVKRIGWPVDETVIGRKVLYPNSDNVQFEVLGVVRDFNYWSLEVDIEPMAIFHINNKNIYDSPRRFVVARLEAVDRNDWDRISGSIEQTWKAHAGDVPFEFGFIDDYFDETFRSQQRFGYVLLVVAGLAILIACLGLLGMIVYSLEQRTKEIGIRKVSGASAWNILSLMSKSYVILILVAFAISSPVSYFMMKGWLEGFPYRVTPSPWIFAFAGSATLLIALLIIGYHSLRAAKANPVSVLKDE